MRDPRKSLGFGVLALAIGGCDADDGIAPTTVSGPSIDAGGARPATDLAPQIRSGPASVTVSEPSTATFSVDAIGSSPLTYAWERKRAPDPGFMAIDPNLEPSATTPTYVSGATTAAIDDGTQVRVVVTNAIGSATSMAATLSVQPSATTVTGPRDRTVAEGTSVDFTVVASPSGGRTYQWQRASATGGAFSDVTGATSPTLTLGGVAIADAGRFRAIVAGATSPATSREARLTVVPLAQAGEVFVQSNDGVIRHPALATQSTAAYSAAANLTAGTFAATATSTTTAVISYAGTLRLRFFNTSAAPVTIGPGNVRAHIEGTYTHLVVPSGSAATTVTGSLNINLGGQTYAARGDHQVSLSYDASGAVTQSKNELRKAVESGGATVVPVTTSASALSMDLVMPALTMAPGDVMSFGVQLTTDAIRSTCAFTATPATITMKLPAGVTLDHDATVPLGWVTNLP